MFTPEFLLRFTYLIMEAYIIGGVTIVLWPAHFRFLWERRWIILLGTLLVSAYALPLDAWAVARGWGGFNPAYVSGIYFFGGSLLLEEIIFWLGTSFVTISAVLIFAELERRGVPWWVLPVGVVLPIEWLGGLTSDSTTSIGAPARYPVHDTKT
ncbi:MAG: hypothetical protein KKC71_11400 [Chloroflexi bacterium]|nr:hypothetical protein [Chloroflexota bacterium]